MQENRIEHLSCGRVETERNVRQPERGVDPGQFGLDPTDPFNRVCPVKTRFFNPGRQRECERIEDQIGWF